MADKIDAFDIAALERSVNDSATRVSVIWLSFVAFSAYLAAAASNVSHRQIFLEEPIKLPTINIDLPLVASAILLPLLFVIYHVYVLLQVVLLARTADAYNEALEHGVADGSNRTLVRQRLANTLFAQLFAGSPREREGLLGWLLRAMAWITLAIAPVLVLLLFEIKFLPYHSAAVTWMHRALIAVDMAVVLPLWAGAVDVRRDVKWRSLVHDWKTATLAVAIVVISCMLVTFPGEVTRFWMRHLPPSEQSKTNIPECQVPQIVAAVVTPGFDRLVLLGEDFVDDDKVAKIVATARTNGQQPHESERTRIFRGRDLRCGRLAGADLRRADFARSDLSGAMLRGANLEGTRFSGARLVGVVLDGAQLQASYFAPDERQDDDLPAAILTGATLVKAQLQGANLREVHLQHALLTDAQLQGANLDKALAHGTNLEGAAMHGASLSGARLPGAVLEGAVLDGANLRDAHLQGTRLFASMRGADLREAQLHGAYMFGADLRGAVLVGASLQGAIFKEADRSLAEISHANVWIATAGVCTGGQISALRFDDTLAVPGAPGKRPQRLKATPEVIASFAEAIGSEGSDAFRKKLRDTLQEALTPDQYSEQYKGHWRECERSALPRPEYEARLAKYLTELACEAGPNQDYVAAGVVAYSWDTRSQNGADFQLFARTILELDGTPCPGARALPASTKEELRKAAARKPAG